MTRLGLCCGAVLLGVAALAAPPNVKTVTLTCKQGWRGSAVGQYGGVGFGVLCDNGRGNVRLTGTVGTAYSIRTGVESDSVAGDCFYTGDAQAVNESCLEVRLGIR